MKGNNMDKKTIRITCEGSVRIDLSELNPLQGKLKSLSKEASSKLKNSILKKGFSFPIFVWRDPENEKWMLIDGHQRHIVLNLLIDEGYDIPPLPCVAIEAETIQEAREKILLASSQYGKLDEKNLLEFCKLLSVPLQELTQEVELSIDLEKFTLPDEQVDPPEEKEKNFSIEYNLVFDNEEQQKIWYEWLRKIKRKYDCETIAQRIIKAIEETANG